MTSDATTNTTIQAYAMASSDGSNRWNGGPDRQLTNFGSLKVYCYQWSPDGKSPALVRGDPLIWCFVSYQDCRIAPSLLSPSAKAW
jgi:hypothetical protein